MKELLPYLPLLNLLVIPLFLAYVKNEVRMANLETTANRVNAHPCFTDRRAENHG